MEHLIRFFTNPDHVWQFLYGQLNMFPAAYYIYTDEYGRLDSHEGAISQAAWMNIETPIYCMSRINDDFNGDLQINKRLVTAFCEDGGYAVIVEKAEFIDCMREIADNKRFIAGEVTYDLDIRELPQTMPSKLPELERVLLRKEPKFAYQGEYRFAYPDANVTYWPLESEWYKVPWKPTLLTSPKSVRIIRIPPANKITGDYLPVNISNEPNPLRGEWFLKPRD